MATLALGAKELMFEFNLYEKGQPEKLGGKTLLYKGNTPPRLLKSGLYQTSTRTI